MGIIALPYLLFSLVLVCISIRASVLQITSNKVSFGEVTIGFIVAVVLSGMLLLHFKNMKETWLFDPLFKIPFFTIILPFAVYFVIFIIQTLIIQHPILMMLSRILLYTVSFSALILVVFSKVFMNLFEFFDIKKLY